jgi:hypothetical protein
VGREDLDRYFDLDKKINDTIDREVGLTEDYLFGELFLESEEHPKPAQKKRGRPPGVKETAPRKKKISLESIVEHIEAAILRLKDL